MLIYDNFESHALAENYAAGGKPQKTLFHSYLGYGCHIHPVVPSPHAVLTEERNTAIVCCGYTSAYRSSCALGSPGAEWIAFPCVSLRRVWGWGCGCHTGSTGIICSRLHSSLFCSMAMWGQVHPSSLLLNVYRISWLKFAITREISFRHRRALLKSITAATSHIPKSEEAGLLSLNNMGGMRNICICTISLVASFSHTGELDYLNLNNCQWCALCSCRSRGARERRALRRRL